MQLQTEQEGSLKLCTLAVRGHNQSYKRPQQQSAASKCVFACCHTHRHTQKYTRAASGNARGCGHLQREATGDTLCCRQAGTGRPACPGCPGGDDVLQHILCALLGNAADYSQWPASVHRCVCVCVPVTCMSSIDCCCVNGCMRAPGLLNKICYGFTSRCQRATWHWPKCCQKQRTASPCACC